MGAALSADHLKCIGEELVGKSSGDVVQDKCSAFAQRQEGGNIVIPNACLLERLFSGLGFKNDHQKQNTRS